MKKWLLLSLILIIVFIAGFLIFKINFNNSEEINENRPIGYIGCSNTMQSIEGYLRIGGETLWDFSDDEIHQYDSGTVSQWSDPEERSYERFWTTFNNNLARNPNTKIIWWQLCMPEDDLTNYEQAVYVIEQLREKIQNVTIYVSPLNSFEEQGSCNITGIVGVERSVELAKELDANNEDVLLGPVLGPLGQDSLEEDLCHLNNKGMAKIGLQLDDFFLELEPEYEPEEKIELSVEEKHWNKVFTKAFEPIDCPEPRDPLTLPNGYYKGPIIDTHIHMHSLPDGEPGMPLEFYTGENIGTKISIDKWKCMLDVEGTNKAFVFFPVWDPIKQESVDIVKMSLEKYPNKFVPFIMPPANDGSPEGFPTVDAKELKAMLEISPGLFKGYGEIGLYERNGGAPALPPNSQRLKEIYPVVRENNLVVYFHLGENQKEALEEVAAANPNITFIFHGDQLVDCGGCSKNHDDVADILEKHPNVYYGVDELYGGEWLFQPGKNKEDFIKNFENYEPLLEHDITKFKGFIESHPDQILFGTDRGVGPSWDKDPEVAIVLNDYIRAFIGKLDPSVQEKFAYKNAEKIMQGR